MKPKNNLDDCTYCMSEGQFKTQTQQTKRIAGIDGRLKAKSLISSIVETDKTAENNQESLIVIGDSPDLNSQRCPMVGVKKKEGGNTQNLHNQPRTFCESEQLDKDGSSLNSQLNPSGCGCYSYNDWENGICGEINNKKGIDALCPICKVKRLATAKALYNEKKKTLEFLEIIEEHFAYLGLKLNWLLIVSTGIKLEEMEVDLPKKIAELKSEIKQIENEVLEVKDD